MANAFVQPIATINREKLAAVRTSQQTEEFTRLKTPTTPSSSKQDETMMTPSQSVSVVPRPILLTPPLEPVTRTVFTPQQGYTPSSHVNPETRGSMSEPAAKSCSRVPAVGGRYRTIVRKRLHLERCGQDGDCVVTGYEKKVNRIGARRVSFSQVSGAKDVGPSRGQFKKKPQKGGRKAPRKKWDELLEDEIRAKEGEILHQMQTVVLSKGRVTSCRYIMMNGADEEIRSPRREALPNLEATLENDRAKVQKLKEELKDLQSKRACIIVID